MVSPGEVNLWYLFFLLGCFEPMSGLITVYTSKVKKSQWKETLNPRTTSSLVLEKPLYNICVQSTREKI